MKWKVNKSIIELVIIYLLVKLRLIYVTNQQLFI